MSGGAQPSSNNNLLKDVRCEKNQCKEIGKGNFGMVYIGAYKENYDADCYKRVALKVLSNKDKISIQEFEQEKEMAKRLKGNPNVVNFYGETTFPDDPTIRCLVFEYYENGDLKKFLDPDPNPKDLDYNKKINILKQICQGMAFIHEKKVLHRDLAARNILLDKNLNAKVGDFGLAVLVENKNILEKENELTQIPIRSMSPRFYKNNQTFNIQTDLWAFGIIVWEIFTQDRINGIEIPVPYNNLKNEGVNILLANKKQDLKYYTDTAFKTNNDFVNGIIKQCFEPAFAKQNNNNTSINRTFTDLLEKINEGPVPIYNTTGGSRKKKRTLKKGGRPKRRQSKKTRKATLEKYSIKHEKNYFNC